MKHLPMKIKQILVKYMNSIDDFIVTECFDNPSKSGDYRIPIYQDDNVRILFCEDWAYFEIYGLGDWKNYYEFECVKKYHRDDWGESQRGYLAISEFTRRKLNAEHREI